MAEDTTCPFKILQHGTYGDQVNSMVCFTLKNDASKTAIEHWQAQFEVDLAKPDSGEVWASNSVQIPQEDGSEIPTLRVNFIRPGHSEETVREVYDQLKAIALLANV